MIPMPIDTSTEMQYKVLITAPSLEEKSNVSGISTVVRNIIEFSDPSIRFIHFKVGKVDKKNRDLSWVLDQLLLVPQFIYNILKYKVDAVHLNTGFERASLNRDFVLFWVARFVMKKKVIFHAHGGYYLMNPPKKGSLLNRMINLLLIQSNVVIVLSDLEKEHLYKNYAFNNCFALPNAVGKREVEHLAKDFNKPLAICFLGRVVKSKGIFVIIEALRSLGRHYNEFTFNLYGTGPELQNVLNELQAIPGLNYTYHGVVGGDKKWKALEESHVFILPSLYGEGLPMAILESMNVQCVPVVTDDASIGTVVEDQVNGFMVKKNDAKDLADKLEFILDHRDVLKPMSIKAHNTIEEKFGMEQYSVDLGNIYAVSVIY